MYVKKGFKENTGDKIYECTTLDTNKDKAVFWIANLTRAMTTYFVNNGDLNDSSVCKSKNDVDIETEIQISGTGVNGLGMVTPKNSIANQKVLIHIIPKIGKFQIER